MTKFLSGFYFIFLAYFFFLSLIGKNFSYLHITINSFPIFIGDFFLFLSLIFSFFRKDLIIQKTLKSKKIFICYFIFLIINFLILIKTLYLNSNTSIIPILKNFAIVYQSLWIFWALSIKEKEWVYFLKTILIAISVSQVYGLFFTPLDALNSDRQIFIYGNEALAALFPLILLLFSPKYSFLFLTAFGIPLHHQVIYLKKSWILNSLITIFLIFKYIEPNFKRKLISFLTPLFLGALIATGYFYIAKIDFTDAPKHLRNDLKTKKFFLHQTLEKGIRSEFRVHMWSQSIRGFLDSPIYGNGYSKLIVLTHPDGSPAKEGGKWISGPHNSFLTLLFRGGLVGFVPFILLIWFTLKRRSLVIHNPLNQTLYISFISISFYAFLNVCLENPQGGTWFWIFLSGLIANLKRVPNVTF